ncbi:lysophospholipid acyltransferase family protein [Thauera phenolivorans]|uniref:lysophospholipid acyltransferase family protein n=1 Tax=Thauera phenolivorans TaxID=1792543 RepID=UPI00083AC21E|nr:lysophospholipid acyltransferase family protein [Thauera phenolivorans]
MLRAWRYARLGLHLLEGSLTLACVFPLVRPATRLRLRQRWSTHLLGVLGIDLRTGGQAVQPGSLLVANHISWVDIFVINALAPTAFISKAEVRAWPLIGWLAARHETVFLRRGSRGHVRQVNAEIAALLEAGRNVAVFPEGTTTDGSKVLGFHAALLQPALSAGHPVQPVALSYRGPDGSFSRAPAYDGDISLGACLAAIVAERGLVAHAQPSAPIPAGAQADRRSVAQAAREIILRLTLDLEPQAETWKTSPSSTRSAVSLPPQTQPESSAISPGAR